MVALRKTILWVVAFVIMITKGTKATQHVVGGSQGWDESTDFDSWAKGQTFKVGDTLVFKYASGLHSVMELGSESDYNKCDISNSVNSLNGGNDVVKLSKVGTRYFACGTAGHCSAGMKLKVDVVAANAPSSTSTTSSSSSNPASSSSSLSFSPFSYVSGLFNFFLVVTSMSFLLANYVPFAG